MADNINQQANGEQPSTPTAWVPWGYHTAPSDERVDRLIDTLKPIDPNTPDDEPRIPVRRRLLDQIRGLVDSSNAYHVEQAIEEEFRQQEERDKIWTSLHEAIECLEILDRMAQDNFRINISVYDTAAKLQNIALVHYERPSDWGIGPQEPTVWTEVGSFWADDKVPDSWDWSLPDTNDSPAPPTHSDSSDSEESFSSLPPLEPIPSTPPNSEEDIPLVNHVDLAGRG